MALGIGTNSGFVTTAPTAFPNVNNFGISNIQIVTKDTSPSTATKITEVGWYFLNVNSQPAVNFEVGLYAADGSGGVAGTLLSVSRTNSTGTADGWKSVTVDWTISSSTIYWIAVQLDTMSGGSTQYAITRGSGIDYRTGQATLSNPFGGGAIYDTDGMFAIYAKWEAVSGPANLKSYNTNLKANIKTINTNPIANVKSLNTNV